jgi:iron uptake system component EfeO
VLRPSLVVSVAAVAALALSGCSEASSDADSAPVTAASSDPQLVTAADAYLAWVRQQASELQQQTDAFVAAVLAGDTATARAVYPVARSPWERIEPVAEIFGDLDPRLDAREGDVEGEWTGWHRLEKDLWVTGLQSDSAEIARRLQSDTADLVTRIGQVTLTADQVTDGAKELMDEVATGKVTGEEERYSRTDLWDFAANVEGARQAFLVVRSVLQTKDAELAAELDQQFAALDVALDQYATADGYLGYDELSSDQIRDLAAAVEALSEPLSQLTAALTR